MSQYRVLILCTGNSSRSQMAEAIVNHDLGETWAAFSAGTVPAGYVHPLALKALQEIGIQHEGCSKSVDQYGDATFDLVITVCDDAAENCPLWLGKGRRLHINFPDPARATGNEEERLAVFRQVRDGIRKKIPAALEDYQKTHPNPGSS